MGKRQYGIVPKAVQEFLKGRDIFTEKSGDLFEQFLKENPEIDPSSRPTFHKILGETKRGNNRIFDSVYKLLELDISPKLKIKLIKQTLDEIEERIKEET